MNPSNRCVTIAWPDENFGWPSPALPSPAQPCPAQPALRFVLVQIVGTNIQNAIEYIRFYDTIASSDRDGSTVECIVF